MASPTSPNLRSPAAGKVVSYRNSSFLLGLIIISGLVILGYCLFGFNSKGGGSSSGQPRAVQEDIRGRPEYAKILTAVLKSGEWSDWLDGTKFPSPAGYIQNWDLNWQLSGGDVEVEFDDGYRNVYGHNEQNIDYGVRYPKVRLRAEHDGRVSLILKIYRE